MPMTECAYMSVDVGRHNTSDRVCIHVGRRHANAGAGFACTECRVAGQFLSSALTSGLSQLRTVGEERR